MINGEQRMITITSNDEQYTGRMSYKARIKLARLGCKLGEGYLRFKWDNSSLVDIFRNKGY